ncbi:lachesin-like [Oratosquilla oratoria]|uniref:lachesin-like n=1 Tax=Oratosquilla oratoria TaxID=337810 RepID=UPI003F776182
MYEASPEVSNRVSGPDEMYCEVSKVVSSEITNTVGGLNLGHVTEEAVSFQPQFEAPLVNQTVVEGREVSFTCIVSHLGGYRDDSWKGVAWIKADSKAILAIHNRVITHSKRMKVVHSDHNTWTLHIKNVQQNDSGQYMCQINTDPMQMQVGILKVVVPPDIILEETSGDIMVTEGSTARLVCRARGVPPPVITWKREDGQPIVLRSQGQPKKEVKTLEGAELTLEKISRGEMGAYFCIASNKHPPSVSKRIVVNVHFHPIVHVPNQLLGAPKGTDISLECMVEASPKSINYWTQGFKNQSSMIVKNQKYITEENATNAYSVTLRLTIYNLESKDFGEYACTAKNSIGEVEGTIKVYVWPM